MAKKSKVKAKAKYAKSAKKKPKKTRASVANDPCDGEEQDAARADSAVDDLKEQLGKPGLSPEQKKRLKQKLQAAQTDRAAAIAALGRCRRLHPGTHGH